VRAPAAAYAAAMPEAFGGLFEANLRDLVKALGATGKSEMEIRAVLAELGAHPL
jgi:hypothetical protein